MELRHLRYLVATIDAGSVSGAAVALHITQPGLSRQLRQLERELGVDLFERRGGRLHASRSASALLPAARDLLRRAEAFTKAARFHAQGQLESLTIGAPTATLTDVVSPFIATLKVDDPRADVMDADGLTSAEILSAGADLAIGTAAASSPYRSLPLAVLPVWAYAQRDHPWADRSTVGIDELLGQPIIALPPTFTAREALDVAAAAAGLAHSPLIEASNGTVAQALAAARRGIAVVSDDPRFGLVPIAVSEGSADRRLCIRLVATWLEEQPAAATIGEIATRLGGFVRDRYGVAPA